jgi:CRISPR-associated exonuclease Cas4
MTSDDDFLPLSALNDLVFCERRCALHRVESLWIDNVHTIEGTQAHKRVHAAKPSDHEESPFRVERGLWLRSNRLKIVGVADLVEFRPQPFLIEYKRGNRRKWDNDDVQLCAQALCLEEMLSVSVPAGAIFHIKSKRRREIAFDAPLRLATEQAVRRLHEIVSAREVPPPVLHPKCKECSLHDVCMPELLVDVPAYQRAAAALFIIPPE